MRLTKLIIFALLFLNCSSHLYEVPYLHYQPLTITVGNSMNISTINKDVIFSGFDGQTINFTVKEKLRSEKNENFLQTPISIKYQSGDLPIELNGFSITILSAKSDRLNYMVTKTPKEALALDRMDIKEKDVTILFTDGTYDKGWVVAEYQTYIHFRAINSVEIKVVPKSEIKKVMVGE